MDNLLALHTERRAKLRRSREILDTAERAGRDLSRRESAEYATLERDLTRLSREIPAFDPRLAQATPFGGTGREPDGDVGLRPEQRVADWLRDNGDNTSVRDLDAPERYSLGAMVRGAVTGRWDGAEPEQRALSESVLADGGYLVPTPLAGQMIDRLRASMQTMQAGATTVPMTAATLNLARLATGATVSWKAEGQPIVESQPGFERLTLTAHTLPIVIRLSAELFEDLSPEANDLIEREISLALSLEVDRACLRGAGVGAEPTGVRNQAGVTLTSLGANGNTPAGWDTLTDAVSVVRGANVEPTAVLWASRTQQSHDKMKSSIGTYVAPPASIATIPRLTTNQIPTNLTVGSSNDCSEIYVGKWSDLLVGIRTDMRFQVRVLDQRYIDNLQYGLLCHLRADVAVAHPLSFNVVTGVRT